jgi:hypothetical protein
MRRLNLLASLTIALCLSSLRAAEEQPAAAKPGPEHAELKRLEGTWDAVMKMAEVPEPMPGVAVYKMECDGMWLASDFKMDVPGFKFQGKGLDGYDQHKKKFVSIWVDSMSSAPMTMEGTHNPASKTTTMTGEGVGQDGKPEKFKTVTKVTDADHMRFEMFMIGADGKETSAFTIDYTRRK